MEVDQTRRSLVKMVEVVEVRLLALFLHQRQELEQPDKGTMEPLEALVHTAVEVVVVENRLQALGEMGVQD